jgi:predicted transcriptional regulator
MAAGTTLTVRLKREIKEQLARLSLSTDRSRAFLAAEAVEAYVVRERARVACIQHGLADMAAGRVIAHDLAMDELDAAIDEAVKRDA